MDGGNSGKTATARQGRDAVVRKTAAARQGRDSVGIVLKVSSARTATARHSAEVFTKSSFVGDEELYRSAATLRRGHALTGIWCQPSEIRTFRTCARSNSLPGGN
eukprot:gene9424-biopygen3217